MRANPSTDALSADANTMTGLVECLLGHGIVLSVQRKSVKNINFRMKQGVLSVSAPIRLSEAMLISAIRARIDWAVAVHQTLTIQPPPSSNRLWGEYFDLQAWICDHRLHTQKAYRQFQKLNDSAQMQWIYRHEIHERLPKMVQKWQSIVGKYASDIRLRHMSSRWGSCNVRTAKITLNTRLAVYPERCLEYVLVHELCHLHHANHSGDFWASVEKAMPDYRQWHDLLNKKAGH